MGKHLFFCALKPLSMKKTLSLFMLLVFYQSAYSQCDPEVPTYVIDLSANPDTTWILYEADALDRLGQCCGVASSQNCIKFEVTLHPNAAGIFFDYDGAGAFGSLNWREDCGTAHSLKDTICVTSQSFTLTFCKPGSDNGNYTLISVPRPTFPDDQFVPMNCIQPVEVLGVTANSVQWESISPGAPGQYNSYLSCTNCLTPTFTPNPSGPTEIRYRVCGYPLLDYCVGAFTYCDTVKFTVQDSLTLDILPHTPAFCSGGYVTLTADADGGDGNYTYIWYNSSLQVVGTGQTYNASVAGTYTCEVRDGNYEPGFCDDFFKSRVVVETLPPVINAGADQVLCATAPNATINGTFQYAAGVTWSGGAGTFQNGLTSASNVYIPTNSEIGTGSVTLTLSSTGVGGGCTNASDQIQLFFVDTVETNLANQTLLCKNGTITVNPTITGGVSPFTYDWTNGINSATNTLGEGTFCLTIVDGNNCQTTHCLTITAPPAMNLTTSSTPATTNGGFDGTATASITGGVAPYTYSWSNGGTTSTITGLNYGIYTVTVTDDNGCQRTSSVVVNEPRCNGYFVSTSSTIVSCFGGSNGTATATPNNGTSPYTYLWNDGATQATSTATNLTAGVYTVTVTDGTGCFAINTATITEPSQIINNFLHSDVTIEGGNDGTAQANVTGGTGPLDYLWSNGATTSTVSGLVADLYYLTVTDDNGCTLVDSVQISEPPCNEFYAMVSSVSPLCNGASTASASLTLLNGVGPYSIQWSTTQTNVMSVSNIPAGFHSVHVIDSRGCEIFQTYGISQPTALSLGLAPTPSTCTGDDNGTIDLTVSGGTYPYYYFNWSNGATTEDQIGLEPGSYSVTVEDENGCQASSGITLVEPGVLAVSETHIDATCFGYADASINVTVTGGTTPYTYSWSNGQTTQDLSGIDLGGYILNVTDANYCSPGQPLTVLISEPALVEAQSVSVACPVPGASTAQVTVVPIGGNANYAISYDGGTNFGSYGTYSSAQGVNASYNAVVMDINGCVSSAYPISIDSNVAITAASFNKCYTVGQTTESVTVTVSGGSPSYSLSSDNGSTYGTPGVSVLTLPIDNTYQLVAMDNKGCFSVPFPILLPDVFDETTAVTSDFNGEDVSCFGSSDGQALSTVSGGTLPYTYAWSNSQTTASATGLAAGTYTVTVEDAFGCTTSGSVTLTEPSALTQSLTAYVYPSGDNVSCFGYSDGSADLTIGGGVAPYQYDWATGQTTPDLSAIPAGTYSVLVTDANGCEISASVTLTEPDGMSHTITSNTYPSGTNISCYGENDGNVDLTITGGGSPYTYDWSNGATTQDLSGLTAGTYSVTVAEVNGCEITASITLTQPDTIVITGTTVDPSCNGFNNGSIDISVAGGSVPYVYTWSTGASTQDLSTLVAGTYLVSLVDENGCAVQQSFVLDQPNVLTLNLNSPLNFHDHNISLYGESDGEIDATVTGGTLQYTYDWSNGGNVEDLSGLTVGIYILTVTDAQGCVISDTIELTQPYALELPTIFTPNQDGENDVFDIHGIEAYPDNELTVVNRWGNVVYTEENYHNTWTGTHNNGEELPDGVYFVILKINGGEIERNTYVHIKKH
jgi:gliding motility-associated-like protein